MLKKQRYGITEAKKAELDTLNERVADAQGDVQRLQSIVDSILVNTKNTITPQVSVANENLVRAQLTLKCEQEGLAAADAAALAC